MPGAFVAQPDVHWRDDGRVELDRELRYRDARGRMWIVPKGFDSDLASIPRWLPTLLRLALPDRLRTAAAAILHDWAYALGGLSREAADDLFYEALRASGVGTVRSWLMWAGVRAGGWWAWWHHRSDS